MKRTKLCRIDSDLADILEKTWPEHTMPERIRNIYNLSIAKAEVILRNRK